MDTETNPLKEESNEPVKVNRTSYRICKSKAKGKKLAVKITYIDECNHQKTRTINIGQIGYRDYPQVYSDNPELAETLKENYLKRNKNTDYTDTMSKQFWSRYLLWNKSTVGESVDFIRSEFQADITLEEEL